MLTVKSIRLMGGVAWQKPPLSLLALPVRRELGLIDRTDFWTFPRLLQGPGVSGVSGCCRVLVV